MQVDKQKLNISEEKFQAYMEPLGIELEREPKFANTNKVVDYRIVYKEKDILFEVAEFAPKDPAETDSIIGGSYDADAAIRNKIKNEIEHFRDLDKFCNNIVLYNCGRWDVDIVAPVIMGNSLHGQSHNLFSPTANARISSIISLEEFPIGQHRFDIAQAKKSDAEGIPWQLRNAKMNVAQMFRELRRAHGTEWDISRTQLRALIFHNPWASHPLPEGLLQGLYDEHFVFDRDSKKIQRIWAGEIIKELYEEEIRLHLDLGPAAQWMEREKLNWDYMPIKLPGEPLSEMIIEERR